MAGNGKVTHEEFRDVLGKLGDNITAETVFGETRMLEGKAVIPVAQVGFGGGGGFGGGQSAEQAEGGEGLGLGFGVTARPIGIVEVSTEGTSWLPTSTATRHGLLLGMGLGMLLVFGLRGLFRR